MIRRPRSFGKVGAASVTADPGVGAAVDAGTGGHPMPKLSGIEQLDPLPSTGRRQRR